MQIIDFVYGGSQFLESDVVRLPDAVGHHTICFTLRLHGGDYHFSRSTERIGYVATYTDPDWKFPSGDMALDEYFQFLLDNYSLSYTQTRWRDIVGRFSRLDEEALGTLDCPLAAVPQQSATAGAIAMLHLNGTYEDVVDTQKKIAELAKDIRDIQRVSEGGCMPYLALRTKTERKNAEEELAQARAESKQLRRGVDLDLFEADMKARKERQAARASLRPLTERVTQLEGRLANVRAVLDGGTRITSADLAEFYTFFPDANREKLETVEAYHHELSQILRDQLEDQRHAYMAESEGLNEQIRVHKAHILALGESVYLDEDTYNHTLEGHGTVQRLEAQIKTYDDKNILKKEKDQLIKTLHSKMIGSIAADFNAEMNRVNAELYPDGGRKVCPKFQLQINGKGISYEFDHCGDRGSGAKSRHLAIFDVAMLRHTPLPFLIHDSAIIKLVGHAPVRALLGAYMRAAELTSGAEEPNQVFFSFDATKAYGEHTEELVDTTRVIHLGDGSEALYGYTWNTETTEEGSETMRITFKPLWKLLIDRDMTREDLRRAAGLSPATIAKLDKDCNVTTDVLARIYTALRCQVSDIAETVDGSTGVTQQ